MIPVSFMLEGLSLNANILWRLLFLVQLLVMFVPGTLAAEEEFAHLELEELMQLKLDINPVSSLATHIHKKGEWMLGYHYMHMRMHPNMHDSAKLGRNEVLQVYPVTPIDMDMRTHMLHAMYAFNEKTTLMLLGQYIDKSMDHVTRTGRRFTTSVKGVGDTGLLINRLLSGDDFVGHRTTLQVGLNLPTGSTSKKDVTPQGKVRLPYPMQLGSGTYDLKLGADYQHMSNHWSAGTSLMSTTRMGENDEGYTLGNVLELTTWHRYAWSERFSTVLSLNGKVRENIDGFDSLLNAALVPTADGYNQAYKRVSLGLEVDYHFNTGNQVSLRFSKPVYQHVDGPQLGVDWDMMFGWQRVF